MDDKPVAAGKSSFDLIDAVKVFAVMDVQPGCRFLDLACGIGRYSMAVADRIGENGIVYAVDLWREGIEALNREIEERSIKNIKTMVADMRNGLPLENDSIDACLVATILHDLAKEEQKAALREVVRILEPGGLLHIVEFKKIEGGPGPPLAMRMDEEDVEDLVAPFGFVRQASCEVGDFNYLVKYRLGVRP